MSTVEAEATIGTPNGLHTRPLLQIVKAATAFINEASESVKIELANLDHPTESSRAERYDATSILSLLLMAASHGHRVQVIVQSTATATADRIASEIASMLASNLDETKAPQLVESA